MAKRIQLKRSKGWKMPPGAVKVDRTTRWGNPFTVADCGTAAVAVANHGRWMRGEIPAPGGAEPPTAAEHSHRPRRPRPRLLVPAHRAVPRRPAAAHRQRRLDAPLGPARMRPATARMRTICIYDAASSRRASRPTAMPAARRLLASLALLALATPLAQAQGVVNIYSARHYQTDEAFYANFTRETGIKINRLDGREDELVERIKNEGASSPADILITVDASRLEIADKAGPVPAGAVEGARGAHPGAPAHAELAGVLDPGAGHRLQQGGDQPRLGADLRRPRRSAPEGPDLRALGQPSLQPVARRRAHRP